MGWGLGIYDPVKIRVKTPCNGYYLMWYYSGWHYWYFLPGRISVLSEGEEYRRLGTQKLSMSSGQIDRDQAAAIRTILLTKEIYILTDYWWKNLRIEPGSVVFYDNSITGAEIEFVGIIGNRLLSMTGFSPSDYSIIIPATFTPITYGALYNWYAATDARNICIAGWHIPTDAEFQTLELYLGMNPAVVGNINYRGTDEGDKLKEIGSVYWLAGNTGTNIYSFNARGTGDRNRSTGVYWRIRDVLSLWTSTSSAGSFPNTYYIRQLAYNIGQINRNYGFYRMGLALRPLKDSTTLTHGQTGTYTGNDGKVYRTICIGTQEWVADNLAETKYRNGDDIPIVTDNGAWAALVTGAMCYYNNDSLNA